MQIETSRGLGSGVVFDDGGDIVSQAPGLGFAIASNTVKAIARQLIDDGHVTRSNRASLGIGAATVVGGGVAIVAVEPDGPADSAGLHRGPIIVSVDGKATPTIGALGNVLTGLKPGSGCPWRSWTRRERSAPSRSRWASSRPDRACAGREDARAVAGAGVALPVRSGLRLNSVAVVGREARDAAVLGDQRVHAAGDDHRNRETDDAPAAADLGIANPHEGVADGGRHPPQRAAALAIVDQRRSGIARRVARRYRDEGGGGGGGTVRRNPSPPDRPRGFDQPPWWPEFERELEHWACERRTRRGPPEPLRN